MSDYFCAKLIIKLDLAKKNEKLLKVFLFLIG